MTRVRNRKSCTELAQERAKKHRRANQSMAGRLRDDFLSFCFRLFSMRFSFACEH